VYPKVVGGGSDTNGLEAGTEALQISGPPLLAEGSAEHKIAFTSMNVFERMITSMCPSWTQKKGCVAAIDEIKEIAKSLDEKLLGGQALDDVEQTFYDEVSLSSLEEKQTLVREMMHKQVDSGQITSVERKQLLDQVTERLQKLEADKATAETEKKPKRVENLKGVIEKATERKEKLEKISPRAAHPLKKQQEINKLRGELVPLLEMEASTKGRLLSLKESQAMGRKEEIEEEIQVLEDASRGWFETDEMFEARLKAGRATFKPPAKKKGAAKSGGSSAAKSSWSTPASRKAPAKSKPRAKQGGGGAGGVFAAMMMDSDSD